MIKLKNDHFDSCINSVEVREKEIHGNQNCAVEHWRHYCGKDKGNMAGMVGSNQNNLEDGARR